MDHTRHITGTPPDVRLGRMALYALLGFSAGLPFYMFSTVLALRLTRHGVPLTVIGFFAWVTLLPTLKFAWAPVLDRFDVPGFARFWGRRRGWIMCAQLGIAASAAAMAWTAADRSLSVTALTACLLAFWTTTLEVAADAWRIELAPDQASQGPIVAANIWGYRSAMVAAGSGALILADHAGWTAAYLAIAAAAFVPFPLLAAMPAEAGGGGGRAVSLVIGVAASLVAIGTVAAGFALVGGGLLRLATELGIGAASNVTPWVLAAAMAPFLALVAAVPVLRRASADSWLRASAVVEPFADFFRRYGYPALGVLVFVSLYRMGDVLALTLSKPLVASRGYSLTQIGIADGAVALGASMAGVALGGYLASGWRIGRTLVLGAVVASVGNFGFVWLAHVQATPAALYVSTALDQFGNGMAGAVFVVYLSLLVNPRFAGAQYAFLSGFAFLLPRLLAGASGAFVARAGYDAFFLLSGALSLAAVLVLPFVLRLKVAP